MTALFLHPPSARPNRPIHSGVMPPHSQTQRVHAGSEKSRSESAIHLFPCGRCFIVPGRPEKSNPQPRPAEWQSHGGSGAGGESFAGLHGRSGGMPFRLLGRAAGWRRVLTPEFADQTKSLCLQTFGVDKGYGRLPSGYLRRGKLGLRFARAVRKKTGETPVAPDLADVQKLGDVGIRPGPMMAGRPGCRTPPQAARVFFVTPSLRDAPRQC
jgi:hypothetical protein